jgi:hypothetical protein
MSEVIGGFVGKAGGASQGTVEGVEDALYWAEQCKVFVVSAPGGIGDKLGANDRVTKQLVGTYLESRDNWGELPEGAADNIISRYGPVARDLGITSLKGVPIGKWIDNITPRLHTAVNSGYHTSSMFGEQLQAEIYEALGFIYLNPLLAPNDLGTNRNDWSGWLHSKVDRDPGNRYVIPGNVTLEGGCPTTLSDGGSDWTAGLVSFGIGADAHWNLTDGPAHTADWRKIDNTKLVDHIPYIVARELGLGGSGLVHPNAMIDLEHGGIPTIVRKTSERDGPFTVLDNDTERAYDELRGQPVSLSLIENVNLAKIHIPGMAGLINAVSKYGKKFGDQGIPLIDAISMGADTHGFLFSQKSVYAEDAIEAFRAQGEQDDGQTEVSKGISLLTLAGYRIGENATRIMGSLGSLPEVYPSLNCENMIRIYLRPNNGHTSLQVTQEVHDILFT